MRAAGCRPKPPELTRSVGLEWPRMTAFWFWIIVAVALAIAEVMTVAFFAVSGYVIGAFLMWTGGGSGALIGAVVGGIIWGSFLRKTSK